MSRCFPFPPPGYEKQIRIDEAGSLIKEKEKKEKEKKEKKHKKEKRDKDKHKERKEKKEKHKDRKDRDRDKEKSKTSGDRKATGNTSDREEIVTNNNGNGESKFIEDLTRRINNEEEATESQSSRKINLPCGVTENNISCRLPETNHRKDDEKRINTHRNVSENAVMVKSVERKDQAKKIELQEKNHCRGSVTKSDKPLDYEGIKKSELKNITDRSSNEKKEENKTCQEKPKFVEGGPRLKAREHESVDTRNIRVPEFSGASVKNFTPEGSLVKRKDLETNGLLSENGSRPKKIQRPVAYPISPVENGRNLGASQSPPKPTSVLQCNPEVKEHRINGFIKPQDPKSDPPVSSVKVKENGEASTKKRPHSDLKYLDQILSVPKREELDNDEQEWLFGQPSTKLLKKQSTSFDENPQIWNQALRIESADIIALPYVVPF